MRFFLWNIVFFFCVLQLEGCGVFSVAGGDAGRESKAVFPADTACAYFHFLRGYSAEVDDQPVLALASYGRALACDETAMPVRERFTVLLIRQGKKQEAMRQIEILKEYDAGDIDTPLLVARLYVELGRYEEAISAYRKLLDTKPDNENLLLLLASLHGKLRQYEEAIALLEKVIALDPDSPFGHYSLARIYQVLRWHSKAAASLERAIASKWSAKVAMELAAVYTEMDKHEAAAALYRKIVAEDPENEAAHVRLANSYIDLKKLDLALEQLHVLRQSTSDRRKVDMAISRIYMVQKKFSEAQRILAAMLEDGIEDPGEVRLLLAVVLLKKGDTEGGKKILAAMDPKDKEYAKSVLGLVQILQEEGETTEAIRILRDRIAAGAEENVDFYVVLGLLYEQEKNPKDAETTYQNALKRQPSNAKLLHAYAMFLERSGRQPEALAMMERVLVIEPTHASALNYVGYLWAEKGENLEKALHYVEQAVSALPEDGFVRDSLGWVYMKLGRHEDAVRELERAVALVTDDPVIFEHLGDACRAADKEDRARTAYGRALELYRDDDKKLNVRRKLDALSR